MQPVWLCRLERDLMLAKAEPGGASLRPQTSEASLRPASRGGVKTTASTRKLRPLEPPTDEAKKRKQAEGHACWLAWCEQKDERRREEASSKPPSIDQQKNSDQHQRKARPSHQNGVDAFFAEWKRTKWREKQERAAALEKRRQHELELLEKFNAEKRAMVLERQAALARLTAEKKKKRKPKKKHVVVPPPVSLHKLMNVELMSPSFQAQVEARMQHQLDLHDQGAAHGNFRDEITTKETNRFQAKIHSTHAHRADSLDQLRHWAKPTPEIYVLASLLYKLVALETPSTIQLVDDWRWLPWSILQTVFRNDLVQTLQAVPIADLSPRSLAVLYLHCAQPRFSADAIEERSAVGSALRMWVNNVAAVHDIVNPATLRVKGIDSLKSSGVSCRDIGALVLLLHVYPHVNFKLKYCTKYTEKQGKARQEDLALLRELYADVPQHPSRNDTIASICVESTSTSDLLGMLDLPDFNQEVPKSRSKLAARLAARLHERHDTEEERSSPRVAPKEKGLHDDFVVVYKLSMPPKQEENALNPINYIQQKRRDSIMKQATPWTPTTQRSSRSSSLLARKKSSVIEIPTKKSTARAIYQPITPLEQHVESTSTDDADEASSMRPPEATPSTLPSQATSPGSPGTHELLTVAPMTSLQPEAAFDAIQDALDGAGDVALNADGDLGIAAVADTPTTPTRFDLNSLGDDACPPTELDQTHWSDEEDFPDTDRPDDDDFDDDDDPEDDQAPLQSSPADGDVYDHDADEFEVESP